MSDDASGSSGSPGLRKQAVLAVEARNGVCVVRLGGELDLYNADAVREALVNACADDPEKIVVDVSEVEFIDSTTLGVLIEARTKLANRNGFVLAGPGLETRRALEISGLDKHFSIHDTVDEALQSNV